jgi:hypothetical protein
MLIVRLVLFLANEGCTINPNHCVFILKLDSSQNQGSALATVVSFLGRHRYFEPLTLSRGISCSPPLAEIARELQTLSKQK